MIEAIYINDGGEIAGRGKLANNDEHALVLLPCDEDHSDVEGCDYDPVELAPDAQNLLVQAGLAPANSSAKAQQLEIKILIAQ